MFKLYLPNEGRRVSIDGSLSERFSMDCGVAQGSCLGPILLTIYASVLFMWLMISFHERPSTRTIEDTQIYLSFKSNSSTSQYREEHALTSSGQTPY